MNVKSFQRLARRVVPGGIHYSARHRQLQLFWWDGVFANMGEATILAYAGLYAIALGATTGQVGLVAAIGSLLGALALFPGAQVSAQWGRRKQLVALFNGIGGRSMLLALALVPFFFQGTAAIYAVIGLVAARTFFNNFANPAWTAFAAEIVPLPLRGRYFSSRNFAMGVTAFISVLLVGWLTRQLGEPTGFQVGFFLAFVAAVAGTVCFFSIPEPKHDTASERVSTSEVVKTALANRPFLAFTLAALVFNLSMHVAGPYFNVFMVRELSLSAATIGALTTLTNVTALVGQRWFGMQYSRLGDMGIFRMTGLIMPIFPLIWSVAQNAWYVAAINLGAGFIWAGYNLAVFNLLLSLSPERGRERFVALYQTFVFLSAFVGPLVGAWLVEIVGFRVLFALSGFGRLAAIILFFRLIAARKVAKARSEDAADSSD